MSWNRGDVATASLSRTTISGLTWLVAQSGGTRVVNFVAQLVLAGLILPAEFGTVALANSVAALTAVVATFGIDEVLLSRGPRFAWWSGSAFRLGLVCSTVAAGLLALFAPLLATIYRSPTVEGLIWVQALTLPVTSLSSVTYAALRHQLEFRFLAVYASLETLLLQSAIVVLAWRGLGAYSFVIPPLAASVIRAWVYWRRTRARIGWTAHRRQVAPLLRAGSTVLGQKLITTARENGDYLVLGLFATQSTVGIYFLAFRLAALPVYTLMTGMMNVLLPALTRLRAEPARQIAATLSVSRLVALVVMPLSFTLAALSPSIINLLFDARWRDAGPLLAILGVGLSFDVVPCVAGSLLNARGEFKAQLLWSALTIVLFFVFIVAGCLALQATGVAIGVAAFFVVTAPTYSYFAMHRSGARIADIATVYLPPVLASGVSVTLGWSLSSLFALGDIGRIVLVGATSLLSYVALMLLLMPAATRQSIRQVYPRR